MKKIIGLFLFIWATGSVQVPVQSGTNRLGNTMPARGLAIATPPAQKLDLFLEFVQEGLAPSHFNLLVLQVDWNYAYESYPELRDPTPLTRKDVEKTVKVCQDDEMRIAPQVNLLGHQSWVGATYALLRGYPELNGTSHVNIKNYIGWPNSSGLCCKDYCPPHPEVHKTVFALAGELMDILEIWLFHAGMDGVFYIRHGSYVRHDGHNKAELYAGGVARIQSYLAPQGKQLMIWGDCLAGGETIRIGTWKANTDNTCHATDLIPKDASICDWHYERTEQTVVYFATKDFDVTTRPWHKPQVVLQQVDDMIHSRQYLNPEVSRHFQGAIEAVWSGADSFLEAYYNPITHKQEASDAVTVKKLIEKYRALKDQ